MDILTSVNDVIAIGVTVTSGAVGDQVYPSGDNAVSKAAADAANVLGTLANKNKELNGTYSGTVETPFHRKVQAECDGAIAAGDWVKIGALNGTTQTLKKWTVSTDAESLRIGLCVVGAADEGNGEFLLY